MGELPAIGQPFNEARYAIVSAASSNCRLIWKASPQGTPVTLGEPAAKIFQSWDEEVSQESGPVMVIQVDSRATTICYVRRD